MTVDERERRETDARKALVCAFVQQGKLAGPDQKTIDTAKEIRWIDQLVQYIVRGAND